MSLKELLSLETLHFKVADAIFSIQAAQAKVIKRLLPSYAPFYLPNPCGKVMMNAIIDNGAVDLQAEGEELGQFDCGGTNHGVYRLADGYKFVISNIDGTKASAMRANKDFSQCTISLYGNEDNQRFGLGNAMMLAFAFSSAYYNIILMHASVVMQGGYGYLSLGKSGTGKSTHSSLWLQYITKSDLLNDDNPALRVNSDGSVTVYGTPWSGKTPCYRNLKVPVGAIVRLEQHPTNVITREQKLQAFASVLSSCSIMIWDEPSYNHITHTVEGVTCRVPVYYLKCRPDEEAARLSYSTIRQN